MRSLQRHATIEVQTAPPTDISLEQHAGQNRMRTAVIVCHGMGQQVAYQTIGDLINTVRRTSAVVGPVIGRLVRFKNGLTLGRAEITFGNGEDVAHEAHVYEAYWAPLTQGRVTLRDVLIFLVRAGLDGARAAARGKFHRFMFNQAQTFAQTRWTFLAFVIALLIIASLLVINFGTTSVVAARAEVPRFGWAGAHWFSHALAGDILVLVLGCAIFTVPFIIPRHTARVGRTCETRMRGLGIQMSRLPMYVLFVSAILAGALTAFHVVLAMAGSAPLWDGLFWPESLLVLIQGNGIFGLWSAVLLLSAGVRWFLVNFAGDIAAYLSAHRLTKFDHIRDSIKQAVFETTCAVYRDGGYGRCLLVGHSLGAVAAYDALNAILNEQAITGATFAPTAGLVTFGAPLDKTAFVFRTHNPQDCDIREALAAAVQPLISFEPLRPVWVNIWSPNDIISGSLDLYDRADKRNHNHVINLIDWQADKPLYAHVQYWSNDLLASVLQRLCRDGLEAEPSSTATLAVGCSAATKTAPEVSH